MSHHAPIKNGWRTHWKSRAIGLAAAALLSACGGGGSDGLSCSAADEKIWLRDYMNDWYYWYAISPSPEPSTYASVETYFQALLYQGTDPDFPKPDTWSYITSEEAYNRTFGEGRTLGYGVMVTGIEVSGHPDDPLYIRYVEPGSPAALAGLRRDRGR
jgi:hypothetical protein